MNRISTVFLSMGSNMGNRLEMLEKAIVALGMDPVIRILRTSSVYESESWGLTGQPKYLNIIVEIETAMEPLELLKTVKRVEQCLGREPSQRWGPRSIDIDLILWGARRMRTPELTLPHEYFRDRAFVLTPLAEIAPLAVDPESGLCVEALSDRLGEAAPVLFADPLCS